MQVRQPLGNLLSGYGVAGCVRTSQALRMAPPAAWTTPPSALAGGLVKRCGAKREGSTRARPVRNRPPGAASLEREASARSPCPGGRNEDRIRPVRSRFSGKPVLRARLCRAARRYPGSQPSPRNPASRQHRPMGIENVRVRALPRLGAERPERDVPESSAGRTSPGCLRVRRVPRAICGTRRRQATQWVRQAKRARIMESENHRQASLAGHTSRNHRRCRGVDGHRQRLPGGERISGVVVEQRGSPERFDLIDLVRGAETDRPPTRTACPHASGSRHMPDQAGYREIRIPYCVRSLSP